MVEMNRYEAPASAEPSPALGRRLASLLLEAREKGYTLGLYYRWQLQGYLVLTIGFGMGIAYFAFMGFEQAVPVMVGTFFGVLLRDYGIARQQTKVWKIQTRLLDWDKVQRMGCGEPVDV